MKNRSLFLLLFIATRATMALALGKGGLPSAAGAPVGVTSRPSPFVLEIIAGPLVGLDRAFRGGTVGLGAGLSSGGLGGLARLGAAWDSSLSAFIARVELRLALGPGLSLGMGAEFPSGDLVLHEERSGCDIILEPAAIPSRFSLEVSVLEFGVGAEAEAAGARPRLAAARLAFVAELAWSAMRALRVEGDPGETTPPLAEALSAESGFAAGFTLALGLRVFWGPR